MKKIIPTLLASLFAVSFAYAQTTAPARNGDASGYCTDGAGSGNACRQRRNTCRCAATSRCAGTELRTKGD